MTEPSEAAKRRACEILKYAYDTCAHVASVRFLARHLDAEDKAARECDSEAKCAAFARRHILPESRPTVRDVLLKQLPGFDEACALIETALRDAGLLKETDCG